jgi:hypothetical protein
VGGLFPLFSFFSYTGSRLTQQLDLARGVRHTNMQVFALAVWHGLGGFHNRESLRQQCPQTVLYVLYRLVLENIVRQAADVRQAFELRAQRFRVVVYYYFMLGPVFTARPALCRFLLP